MKDICVFTPTYNRAYCLESLFESLCNQEKGEYSFYWLVVDDGSTDNTKELIYSFIEKEKISIEYVYQENGGKQRAHNTGVQYAKCELFFCVDSDDTLPNYSLSTIWSYWKEIRNNPTIAGVIGLCGSDEKTPLGTKMPSGLTESTRWDLYYRFGHKGDTATAYRLDVLRQYPFWVADNEKFIAETYVYHQIDQHYFLGILNRVLITCEYRVDGYTANRRKIARENPEGYLTLKRMFIGYSTSFLQLASNTTLYLVGCIFAKKGIIWGIKNAPNKGIAVIAAPLAWLLSKTEFQR